jgi:hypothetical protein
MIEARPNEGFVARRQDHGEFLELARDVESRRRPIEWRINDAVQLESRAGLRFENWLALELIAAGLPKITCLDCVRRSNCGQSGNRFARL